MVELTKHIFKITTRTPIRVNKPTDDKMILCLESE